MYRSEIEIATRQYRDQVNDTEAEIRQLTEMTSARHSKESTARSIRSIGRLGEVAVSDYAEVPPFTAL